MKGKFAIIFTIIFLIVIDIAFLYVMHIYAYPEKVEIVEEPEQALLQYFSLIQEEKYDDLIKFVNIPSDYSVDSFIARNRNIYQGIDARNIGFEILDIEKLDDNAIITFRNTMKITRWST